MLLPLEIIELYTLYQYHDQSKTFFSHFIQRIKQNLHPKKIMEWYIIYQSNSKKILPIQKMKHKLLA